MSTTTLVYECQACKLEELFLSTAIFVEKQLTAEMQLYV